VCGNCYWNKTRSSLYEPYYLIQEIRAFFEEIRAFFKEGENHFGGEGRQRGEEERCATW
jgi:hypothetical protein